jgi:hypothetical protein
MFIEEKNVSQKRCREKEIYSLMFSIFCHVLYEFRDNEIKVMLCVYIQPYRILKINNDLSQNMPEKQ